MNALPVRHHCYSTPMGSQGRAFKSLTMLCPSQHVILVSFRSDRQYLAACPQTRTITGVCHEPMSRAWLPRNWMMGQIAIGHCCWLHPVVTIANLDWHETPVLVTNEQQLARLVVGSALPVGPLG